MNNADGTIIKDETEFKENATVFAVSKRKIVGYKVEHLKENIEDENYTKAEEEPKTGEAGRNTSAEAKQYEGFSYQGLAQTVIKVDGSTVVQIKYKRNRVSLILDLDGGETTTQLKDGKDGKKLLEGKFEARVEVKGLEKENYSFEKWEPELPQTFPATSKSTIYIAKWETQTVVYRVAVAGDERVKVLEPNYINVPSESNKKIEDIKAEILAKVSLKAEWSDVDYTFYDWRIGGEEGEEMLDSTPINEDMVVYARTNYKRFKLDGTILIGYEGKKPRGRIFIPKEITLIRGDAFIYCMDLTAVDLSSCTKLEEIRYGAFYSCRKLRSVNLNGCSKLVTIAGSGSLREEGSFSDCTSLESIDLSQCNNLAKIESYAFYGCRKLKSVNLTDCTEIKVIDTNAFEGCTSLESIDLSPCIKLEEIRYGAFYGCSELKNVNLTGCTKLTRLGLDGTVMKNIDLSACTELVDISFTECKNLESIDLSPCTELESLRLSGTSIKNIDLSPCTKLKLLRLNGTAIKNIDLLSCTELVYISFTKCENLESIDLSPCTKLEHIGMYDFFSCSKLKTVNLTGCSEIEVIGTHAFEGCTSLESIDLSPCIKLKEIGYRAFYGCSKADVKIPASITRLGYDVFGRRLDTCCKKVLVPNAGIKQLVVNSGYPEERIELY